jgi:cholesterol oxidase
LPWPNNVGTLADSATGGSTPLSWTDNGAISAIWSELLRNRHKLAIPNSSKIERAEQPQALAAVAKAAATKQEASTTFIVASCQYPAGLMDNLPARASTDRACDKLEEASFALFLGDQIYADATAGLADATRRDELYDYPHERALRQPALRALMRRIPVATLLDDHEISDNWEPQWQKGVLRSEDRRAAWRLARERGMHAFYKYERMSPQVANRKVDLSCADQTLEWGGVAIYLLDTRSQRALRGQQPPGQQRRIVTQAQMAALQAWLLEKKDQVKFVATPSMLLPRQRVAVSRSLTPDGGHLQSDSWDGYPEDLNGLLDFISKNQIGKTVFLSGDEHHSSVSQICLKPTASSVVSRLTQDGAHESPLCTKLLSVHSSALYAPFPFANGRASDLSNEAFTTLSGWTGVGMTTHLHPGDGFALIRVVNLTGENPMLGLRFVKAEQQLPAQEQWFPL